MYKTRVKIFLGIITGVITLLLCRIAHLQLVRGEQYRRDYEQSIRDIRLLPAARGQITDRLGRILAVDLPCKDFCLDYRFITKDPRWVDRQVALIRRQKGVSQTEAEQLYRQREACTWRLANQLAQECGSDLVQTVGQIVERVQRIGQAARQRAGSDALRIREEQQAHAVVRALPDERAVFAAEDVQAGRTVGATVRPSHRRYYPYGELACHVVGVTAPVTAQDLANPIVPAEQADWLTRKRINYEPDDTKGISGVEKMSESMLRGRRGYRLLESGRATPLVLESAPAEAGDDMHLTLDLALQQPLTEQLRATGHNGAVVVLSVPRGEVLAMVSVPTYDLNRYREESGRLFADEVDLPLYNRAVMSLYPPGSTAKLVAAIAALSTGKITPHSTFHCHGCLFPGEPWHWRCTGAHGAVSLHRGIMKSCNVYFYELGNLMGPLRLCEWHRMFGVHELPGTGLPAERAGFVPTQEWVLRTERRRFSVGDARQMAIGQGPLLVTPMHMANLVATIARNGRMVQPRLVLEDDRQRVVRDLPIADGHLREVRRGMESVVHERGGTGYRVFHQPGTQSPAVRLCGKTGTAQASRQWVDRNRDGRVDPGEIVREGDMAWFVGFAPADDPQIAFAVVIEYVTAGGGASNAGPVARELIRLCGELGYLQNN
ncbi:MAG TPA: penicillin-binding transpeptidase domain-containing protein [Phycisphaerae bacterium]|nr:penicillin-binding transpeptidase domain-containing protein [Phycisphaerae bacterium]HUT61786.1 penicillin-binding transpeptidase domain-containing protein [Phycisphaerae bacterium]